jgi:CheY-like chemotaxis protein
MFDRNDLKWLAAQTTELNTLLQQICRYSNQARGHSGEPRYLDLLNERVDLAAEKSQALFNRVAGRMLAGAGATTVPSAARPAASAPLPKSNIVETIPGVEENGRDETNHPQIRNPKGTRELILLVDDDEEVLESTGDILEFENYRILTAKSGPEALQVYRQFGKQIALVILDYFLPVMDGDGVFSTLKAMDPEVRVVLSSGFTEMSQLGGMLSRGLCGFVPKPHTTQKVIEQIRLVLDA